MTTHEDPRPLRDEREGDDPRALRPLRRDEQDPGDRQQDGRRFDRDEQDGCERVVCRLADDGTDDHDEHSERDGGDLQPEAGAGVDHLAQLDGGQPGEAGAGMDACGVHADRCGEGGGAHCGCSWQLGKIGSVVGDGTRRPPPAPSRRYPGVCICGGEDKAERIRKNR